MYDGQETEVELICDNCLMKNVIDRFGEDIKTEKISETLFRAFVPVSAGIEFENSHYVQFIVFNASIL